MPKFGNAESVIYQFNSKITFKWESVIYRKLKLLFYNKTNANKKALFKMLENEKTNINIKNCNKKREAEFKKISKYQIDLDNCY